MLRTDCFCQNESCALRAPSRGNRTLVSEGPCFHSSVSFVAPMAVDLHAAARNGDLAALALGVANGADINGRDKLRRTPLHLAAWAGKARADATGSFEERGLRNHSCSEFSAHARPKRLVRFCSSTLSAF